MAQAGALDLVSRYDDVRRLICGHPAFKAAVAEGMDCDDLLQELLVRLVRRQGMRSRWDPKRASLSKYLFVFTTTATANLVRDHRRRKVEALLENDGTLDDGGSTFEHDSLDDLEQLERACHELDLGEEAVALVRQVVEGQLRRDAAEVVALGELVRERIRRDGP